MSQSLKARVALAKHGFHPTHSLGQNFILEDELTNRIVDAAGVTEGMNVLEIGPGAGLMTAEMAARGAKVLAIEIDASLRPVLKDVLEAYPNASVVYEDAMKADLRGLTKTYFGEGRFSVVANLPYYITTDVIMLLLRLGLPIDALTMLVQKEAAERIMASPKQKAYCALAATVQFYGRPEMLFAVPPETFTPRPHVDSALLRIELYAESEKPVAVRDETMMLRLINASFAMRRKTLMNNLTASFGLSKDAAAEALRKAGLDEKVRGEALALSQLGELSDVLYGEIAQ